MLELRAPNHTGVNHSGKYAAGHAAQENPTPTDVRFVTSPTYPQSKAMQSRVRLGEEPLL